MASIDKRRGKWRAQVRRDGHSICKTFQRKSDAEEWAREIERSIDKQIDPTTRQVSRKDSFASLIDLHINDLGEVGKPLRRSKRSVLNRLRTELGDTPLSQLTREKLIQYGRHRAKEGAGPATLAVDISFTALSPRRSWRHDLRGFTVERGFPATSSEPFIKVSDVIDDATLAHFEERRASALAHATLIEPALGHADIGGGFFDVETLLLRHEGNPTA